MELELLPQAIVDDFRKYTEEKSKEIDKAVRKRTAEALSDITANAPVRKRVPKSGVIRVHGVVKDNYQPGAYKKGFVKYISTAKAGRTVGYVRNKTNHQLVHLLELGHDLKNSEGVVYGHVEAFPNLLPNEEKARERLAEDIDRILTED